MKNLVIILTLLILSACKNTKNNKDVLSLNNKELDSIKRVKVFYDSLNTICEDFFHPQIPFIEKIEDSIMELLKWDIYKHNFNKICSGFGNERFIPFNNSMNYSEKCTKKVDIPITQLDIYYYLLYNMNDTFFYGFRFINQDSCNCNSLKEYVSNELFGSSYEFSMAYSQKDRKRITAKMFGGGGLLRLYDKEIEKKYTSNFRKYLINNVDKLNPWLLQEAKRREIIKYINPRNLSRSYLKYDNE